MDEISNKLWKEIVESFEDFLYGPLGIEKSVLGNISGEFFHIDLDVVEIMLKKLKELEKMQNGITASQREKLEFFKEDFLNLDNGKNAIQEIYYQLSEMYKKIDEL